MEAHASTTTSTVVSPRNTALSPLVALRALSNQSQLESHSTASALTFYPDDWNLLFVHPLLLGCLHDWEHPVSLFDEGVDSGTLMNQSEGLYMDNTQPQLAESRFHLPQTDRGCNQEPPLPYDNQATIPVSTIAYTQPAREGLEVFELTSADLILPGLLLGRTLNRDFTGRWFHLHCSSARVRYLSLFTIQRAVSYHPSNGYESRRTLPATPST